VSSFCVRIFVFCVLCFDAIGDLRTKLDELVFDRDLYPRRSQMFFFSDCGNGRI